MTQARIITDVFLDRFCSHDTFRAVVGILCFIDWVQDIVIENIYKVCECRECVESRNFIASVVKRQIELGGPTL